jgi:hypothetical protein
MGSTRFFYSSDLDGDHQDSQHQYETQNITVCLLSSVWSYEVCLREDRLRSPSRLP